MEMKLINDYARNDRAAVRMEQLINEIYRDMKWAAVKLEQLISNWLWALEMKLVIMHAISNSKDGDEANEIDMHMLWEKEHPEYAMRRGWRSRDEAYIYIYI